jgi:hypothetical protein
VPLVGGGGGAVCIDVVNREFFVRPCNRFADWEGDGNGSHMEDYYTTLSYRSVDTVQLDYSEAYTGSYESTGGKIRLTIENSLNQSLWISVATAWNAIPGKADELDTRNQKPQSGL